MEEVSKLILLPNEVLLKIFQYLSANDLCSCSNAVERWRNVTNDDILWNNQLRIESRIWAGFMFKNQSSDLEILTSAKQIFDNILPIYEINSNSFIKKSWTTYLNSIFKSYMGLKTPHIAVMGPGLDNYKSGKFFGRIFHNTCLEFEPLCQFVPHVGSGVTMKMKDNVSYQYKFHFYLLHAIRPQSQINTEDSQEIRMRESALFQRFQGDITLNNLNPTDLVKTLLRKFHGFIYSIDASISAEDCRHLITEFKSVYRYLPSDTPVIFLLIKHADFSSKLSPFEVVRDFLLYKLNRPWCVLIADSKDTHVLKQGISWILQKLHSI